MSHYRLRAELIFKTNGVRKCVSEQEIVREREREMESVRKRESKSESESQREREEFLP